MRKKIVFLKLIRLTCKNRHLIIYLLKIKKTKLLTNVLNIRIFFNLN